MARESETLSDTTVLVTGGGRGIGRALALNLAEHGARIAITGTRQRHLDETLADLVRTGTRALALQADVRDAELARSVVRRVNRELGGPDVLINNAGLFGAEGSFERNDLDAWWRTLEVNLKGSVVYAHAVLDGMLRRRRGTIVNLASHAAVQASPSNSSYAVSKAAVLRFTDSLAESVRDRGIRVFAVSPGLVRTDMTRNVPRLESLPDDQWRSVDAIGELVRRLLVEDTMALTGGYYHVDDDLDELLARADEVASMALFRLTRATLPETASG